MTRISSIYHQAHGDPPKGEEARSRNRNACAEAWHSHGLIVIDPDEITDDWTRQAFINEAEKQYGRKGSK